MLRCASFTEANDAAPSGDAAREGEGPSLDGAVPADSAADAYIRTGVVCSGGKRCAVGESCCGDGSHPGVCATDCVAADASFTVFECGQTTDCEPGRQCCGSQNGDAVSCGGRLVGSRCVPTGNCQYCGADGGGASAHLCDITRNDECPGSTCNKGFDQSLYTACAP